MTNSKPIAGTRPAQAANLRPALIAAGLLAALCGSARADWQDTVDLLHPECRNTPVAQMTRAKIEECEMIERIYRAMDENLAKARADAARTAKPSTWKCQETADIICERWPTSPRSRP